MMKLITFKIVLLNTMVKIEIIMLPIHKTKNILKARINLSITPCKLATSLILILSGPI